MYRVWKDLKRHFPIDRTSSCLDGHQAVHQNNFETLLILSPPLSAPCYKPLPLGTRLDYICRSDICLDEARPVTINPASIKCNPPQRNDSFHVTGPARRSETCLDDPTIASTKQRYPLCPVHDSISFSWSLQWKDVEIY